MAGSTFVFYILWKAALLMFTSQPVPANDCFFYDGPVVNYLLHGSYCNPALANVLPISGREVFCAYPPLYQAVLLGWMKCFGTSEFAAMWLHFGLLAAFAVVVWLILRSLNASAPAVNLAGLFLFGITFHDRPDTLAQLLAACAVLALVRGLPGATAVLLVLTFATSFQIGGIYLLWLGTFVLSNTWFGKKEIPWAAMLSFVAALIGLLALVRFGYPRLWEGFREHVAITPSVTGWRLPSPGDVTKLIRNSPGNLLVLAGLIVLVLRKQLSWAHWRESKALRLVASGCAAALALQAGCLLVLSPNTVHMGTYLQPVLVGGFLVVLTANGWWPTRWRRVLTRLFLLATVCVSIRAFGMSTWGILCACDVSRNQALAAINQELDELPAGKQVIVSAAYLYETARRTNVTWLHSDWTMPAVSADWERLALERLQPARMFLTQFDYYRRYGPVLSELQRCRGDVTVHVINLARVPSPEAIPATRKVVQYISWAPVIVDFSWPATTQSP